MHLPAMFAGLDILPLEGARSPMHLPGQSDILERIADPDCEAGAHAWDLFRASKTPGRITTHLGAFQLRSAREAGYAALPLGRSLGAASRGAGLLVRADRTCLAFRTADRKPWGRGAEPHREIEFLPIVLRLAKLLPYGDDCVVRPELSLGPDTPEIVFTSSPLGAGPIASTEAREISRSMGAQLCWETTAWSNMLDEISGLAPDGTWPAAFPSRSLDEEGLLRFKAHAARAARYLVDKEQSLIQGVMVRVISGRRLQGGVAPARLSLRLDSARADVVPASEHDRICARASRLIFRGEFAADRLIAQDAREDKTGVSRGLDRVQLASISASGPLSNHERLELLAEFGDESD